MDNSKFDRLIYLASQYAGQPERDIYDNATTSFVPSKKYRHRMNRFLKRIKRQEKWAEWKSITVPLKRIAVAIMLVCTVSLGCILSISAVREAIWETIVSWYEEYIEVLFVADEGIEAPTEILVYKEPTAGLDGYERFEMGKNSHRYHVEYESDNNFVKYVQSILGVSSVFLTNEESILSDIEISGNPGVYIKYALHGRDFIALTWNDWQYQYTLDGTVSLEEFITIAESVE